ncbi:MAG: alpha/beta hydrolase [Rhizobiaceae bacterium]|nr:alpha/beta hydrolase [Rhizobiaceae bacterium]
MIKRILLGALAFFVLLGIAGAATLYLAPGFVVSTMQSAVASSSGLESKSVEVDGDTVHYYEGGTGPTLVLLHGMADEKNSFAAAAAELTDAYRVILPDLAGHGENARDPGRDYSIAGHVAFLDQVFAELGLESFVLGGNSMGGHVSAAYTLAHPDKVEKLILVNAPGLKLDDHVVYGGFGERMETREDFYAVMDRVVHTRPSLPGPIVDHMIAQTNKDFDFINGLAEAVKSGGDFDLKDRVSAIEVPTLILWGVEDQVVRYNVAEGYDRLIPNSTLVRLQEAGHSPQLEKPAEIGQAIDDFLRE